MSYAVRLARATSSELDAVLSMAKARSNAALRIELSYSAILSKPTPFPPGFCCCARITAIRIAK
jgi:hypothetical protein